MKQPNNFIKRLTFEDSRQVGGITKFKTMIFKNMFFMNSDICLYIILKNKDIDIFKKFPNVFENTNYFNFILRVENKKNVMWIQPEIVALIVKDNVFTLCTLWNCFLSTASTFDPFVVMHVYLKDILFVYVYLSTCLLKCLFPFKVCF